MKTPREYAEEAYRNWDHPMSAVVLVERAIAKAMEEMREECAQVADNMARRLVAERNDLCAGDDAYAVMDEIKALKVPR